MASQQRGGSEISGGSSNSGQSGSMSQQNLNGIVCKIFPFKSSQWATFIPFILLCDPNTLSYVVKLLFDDGPFPSMHFLACGFITTPCIELHVTRLNLLLHNIVLFLLAFRFRYSSGIYDRQDVADSTLHESQQAPLSLILSLYNIKMAAPKPLVKIAPRPSPISQPDPTALLLSSQNQQPYISPYSPRNSDSGTGITSSPEDAPLDKATVCEAIYAVEVFPEKLSI